MAIASCHKLLTRVCSPTTLARARFFTSASPAQSQSALPPPRAPSTPALCGRGDKKTKAGKRFRGTFGNSRPDRGHKIRRIKEKWELPPNTPWPVPGLGIEDYRPIF